MAKKQKNSDVHASHGSWTLSFHSGTYQCKGIFRGDGARNHAAGAALHIARQYSGQMAHAKQDGSAGKWIVVVKGDACKDYVEWLETHHIPVKAESGIDISQFTSRANQPEIALVEFPPPPKRWSDEHPPHSGERFTQRGLFNPDELFPPDRPRRR